MASRWQGLGKGRRSGFTLVELMIVVAVVLALTALGVGSMNEMIPRYRTRQAAKVFAAQVQQCRSLAIQTNRECSILLVSADGNLSDLEVWEGEYWVGLGNRSSGSTTWDYLPVDADTDGSDDDTSEGVVDLGDSENAYFMRQVGLAEWDALSGPGVGNSDRLVISPRGYLNNPAGDFGSTGAFTLTFVNKVAKHAGLDENWSVQVTRGGVVRVDPTNSSMFAGAQYGTDTTSGS